MPTRQRARHIFGALAHQAKPYLGNFLYHIGQFAKRIGVPAPLVEAGVNAGLGYITDYDPGVSNPTLGYLPPQSEIARTVDISRRMNARKQQEAEKQISKDFGIIDYPPMRRTIPYSPSKSPFGHSSSDIRYRPSAARLELMGVPKVSPYSPAVPHMQQTASVYEISPEQEKQIKNRAASIKRERTKKKKEEMAREALAAAAKHVEKKKRQPRRKVAVVI